MVLILNILYWVYISVLVVSLIYGLFQWRRLKVPIYYVVGIIGFSLVCELAGEVLYRTIKTNFPTFHILNMGLIILYPLAYKSFWQSVKYDKALVYLGIALATLFFISVVRTDNGWLEFPSFSSAILSLVVVLLGLITFYKELKNPVFTSLFKQPLFWFNAGNIIFYTVTFFVFGYYNYFSSSQATIPNWFPFLFWISNMILYGSYVAVLRLAVVEGNEKIGE